VNDHAAIELPLAPELPPLRADGQGVFRIGRTRVTLDTVVAAFQRGDAPEEIARNYDALSLGEVYQTIGYYLTHQEEVNSYLDQRQVLRVTTQERLEAQHNPAGIRERLLARRDRSS
jgi:uncharacterized protein (DUF433 family)